MELLALLLCLTVIFGYFTGNIAAVILVSSVIRPQNKAAGYVLRGIGAILTLALVNLPALLWAQITYDITYDIGAGTGSAEFNWVTMLSFCWMTAVILTGWGGIVRDWYLKCRAVRQQKGGTPHKKDDQTTL
ncbi:MAG: hypothetical protein D3904_12415 [Candidatus Electrothrix sp. EH2]|nr:hypothetical protein [Candidatus Electrothrix sp. EH2]